MSSRTKNKFYAQRAYHRIAVNRNINYFESNIATMSNVTLKQLHKIVESVHQRGQYNRELKAKKLEMIEKLITSRIMARINQ